MEQKLLTIGRAAKLIGVSIETLRRWDKSGKLASFRPLPSSHRYYRKEDIELFVRDLLWRAKNWAASPEPNTLPSDYYCQTKDVFEARLTRLQNDLARDHSLTNLISIIISVTGEIGNNSFDHNLGAWPDTPGIFFGYDLKRKQIALADRGQGVLETLKRVKKELKTDEDALMVAFTEIISGRAPEARGNGLKYVKKVITENDISLLFQSGDAELFIKKGTKKLTIQKSARPFRGCVAILNF